MRRIHVDVVMAGKLVSTSEARRVTRALQMQVRRDLAPVWNVTADVAFIGSPSRARPGAWQLVLLDEADREVDGYHELTREGLPLGRVYLRTAMKGGAPWSTTASHELLELLVNPDATLGVFVWDASLGGRIYSYEICDPCQDDRFAYRIDDVAVSDFVHPAWFETWRKPRSARFDHTEKLTRAFQVPTGCYATFYDARRRKWVDNYGGKVTPKLLPIEGYGRGRKPAFEEGAGRGGSRKLLRQVPRPAWQRSAV